LNTSISYVEAFDVLKLCIDKEFKLQKVPYEKSRQDAHHDMESPLEILAVREE